jgi:hypothetical protein
VQHTNLAHTLYRGLMRGLVLLLAACHYAAPEASTADTAPVDIATTDNAGAACVEGVRGCIDAARSGVCVGGELIADRDCPPTSVCMAGVCAPPAGATACTGDVGCVAPEVCDVYVMGGALAGFCTPPIGATSGSCTTAGYDATCDSGICAAGGDTRCLSPCVSQVDCLGGNQTCDGVTAPGTIDGQVTTGLKHCVPD